MALEGLHHVTTITADAPATVDLYARVLGLRMVKKTVNFDAPDVYHLYFGDERGTPGSILTFFEFPRAARGRAGEGDPYVIEWRVGSQASLDFWAARLKDAGVDSARTDEGLHFADHEGLRHTFLVDATPDAPLAASAPDIPAEHALRGFAGVRAYASDPARSAPLLDALGFGPDDGTGTRELAGAARRARYAYDAPPAGASRQGAGSIHHVAWSAADDAELDAVRARAAGAGAHATTIIDRQYFHSVYFREPSGVLFELASRDIGFDVDEPAASLGQELKLPPQHEARRDELVARLTPLTDPRARQEA